jgi:hypothetical protein
MQTLASQIANALDRNGRNSNAVKVLEQYEYEQRLQHEGLAGTWRPVAVFNSSSNQFDSKAIVVPACQQQKNCVTHCWCQWWQGGFTQTSNRLVCFEEVHIYSPRRISNPQHGIVIEVSLHYTTALDVEFGKHQRAESINN